MSHQSIIQMQVGFYFTLGKPLTGAPDDEDYFAQDFQMEQQVAALFEQRAPSLACWTKKDEACLDMDIRYRPYELCELGCELDEIDGKACVSLWIHAETQIPPEDLSQLQALVKACIAEVAKASQTPLEYKGAKGYWTWRVQESKTLDIE